MPATPAGSWLDRHTTAARHASPLSKWRFIPVGRPLPLPRRLRGIGFGLWLAIFRRIRVQVSLSWQGIPQRIDLERVLLKRVVPEIKRAVPETLRHLGVKWLVLHLKLVV